MDYNIISFNEVLYYLDINELVQVLSAYEGKLHNDGYFIISMKDDPKSKLYYRIIMDRYKLLSSVLLQTSSSSVKYDLVRDQRNSTFLIALFRITKIHS